MLFASKRTFLALCATACAVITLSGGTVEAQWQQRYDNWRQDRDQRYEQWRSSSQRGGGIGGLIDMFSGDVEPGQYDVRLPLGINFRVNVNEERRRYDGGRAPHTIDAVIDLSVNIRESLRFMHSRARRFGGAEMTGRISEALDQIEAVLAAARSDASLDEIAERVSRFGSTWHDLETYLRRSEQIGPRFRTQLDQISDYDSRLHRTVSISPSRGYDRVEAVAVARRIELQTETLLSDLEYRVEPGAGIGRVLRGIRDAHQQAEDLYRSIRHGESYESVRREYQQFDRAWHDAFEVARGNQNLSRRMWQQHQEIDELDTRMHDILRVESPLAQGKRTWVDRSRSLAMSTDDLLRFIRNSDLRGSRGRNLGLMAEDLAVAADDFHQWFEAGNRNMQEAEERVSRIARQWRELDSRLSEFSQSSHPQLMRLAQQVDQKLQRLQERFVS